MILSDTSINGKLKNKELLVTEHNEAVVGSASNMAYDLTTKGFYSKEEKKEVDNYTLESGESVFVATTEMLALPNDIAARISLKYSKITDGILLDAPIYQPGHKGTNIFFRLTNISNKSIELSSEEKYAYIYFYQTQAVEEPYIGRFTNPDVSIREIREHSYQGLGHDIEEFANNTRNKVENVEKTIYGNVLVIITVFITLFSLLSVFFNSLSNGLSIVHVFIVLGSIMALITAVSILLINDRDGIYKTLALLAITAFIFGAAWLTNGKSFQLQTATNQVTSIEEKNDYSMPFTGLER